MTRLPSLIFVLLVLSLCVSTAYYRVAYSDEIEAFGTDTVSTSIVSAEVLSRGRYRVLLVYNDMVHVSTSAATRVDQIFEGLCPLPAETCALL